MKVYKSSLSRLFCLHNETLVLMRFSTGFWDFVQVMVGWWPYVEPVEFLNFLVSFLVKCLIRVQWVCGQPTGIHCICDAYSALSRFFSFESLADFQMRNRKLKDSLVVTQIGQIKVFLVTLMLFDLFREINPKFKGGIMCYSFSNSFTCWMVGTQILDH